VSYSGTRRRVRHDRDRRTDRDFRVRLDEPEHVARTLGFDLDARLRRLDDEDERRRLDPLSFFHEPLEHTNHVVVGARARR